MFTIEFKAHNSDEWRAVHNVESRAAYELICALNFTGFSYRASACGVDVTEGFEAHLQMSQALNDLPVIPTAGGIPKAG